MAAINSFQLRQHCEKLSYHPQQIFSYLLRSLSLFSIAPQIVAVALCLLRFLICRIPSFKCEKIQKDLENKIEPKTNIIGSWSHTIWGVRKQQSVFINCLKQCRNSIKCLPDHLLVVFLQGSMNGNFSSLIAIPPTMKLSERVNII